MSLEDDFYLLMAKATYLSTKWKVDHVLCGQMIEGLMREAGRIAAAAKGGPFLVESEKTDVILWDMTVVALANYAIMNHEYVTVVENHVHYLMGRNREAEILMEGTGGGDAAKMLLLLSVVETERVIIEESGAEAE